MAAADAAAIEQAWKEAGAQLEKRLEAAAAEAAAAKLQLEKQIEAAAAKAAAQKLELEKAAAAAEAAAAEQERLQAAAAARGAQVRLERLQVGAATAKAAPPAAAPGASRCAFDTACAVSNLSLIHI